MVFSSWNINWYSS